MGAGAAVGGRRALVEAPDRRVGALGEGAGEEVLLAPALERRAPRGRGRTASGRRGRIRAWTADCRSGAQRAVAGWWRGQRTRRYSPCRIDAGSQYGYTDACIRSERQGGAGDRRGAWDRLRDRASDADARRLGGGARPRSRAGARRGRADRRAGDRDRRRRHRPGRDDGRGRRGGGEVRRPRLRRRQRRDRPETAGRPSTGCRARNGNGCSRSTCSASSAPCARRCRRSSSGAASVGLVSSVYAFANGFGNSPYAVAKPGVESLGRSLRVELAPHGASATVAYFGWVDTTMVQDALSQPDAQKLNEGIPSFLMKRIKPDEAAAAFVRGIEERAPRVFAPKWWRYVLRPPRPDQPADRQAPGARRRKPSALLARHRRPGDRQDRPESRHEPPHRPVDGPKTPGLFRPSIFGPSTIGRVARSRALITDS